MENAENECVIEHDASFCIAKASGFVMPGTMRDDLDVEMVREHIENMNATFFSHHHATLVMARICPAVEDKVSLVAVPNCGRGNAGLLPTIPELTTFALAVSRMSCKSWSVSATKTLNQKRPFWKNSISGGNSRKPIMQESRTTCVRTQGGH